MCDPLIQMTGHLLADAFYQRIQPHQLPNIRQLVKEFSSEQDPVLSEVNYRWRSFSTFADNVSEQECLLTLDQQFQTLFEGPACPTSPLWESWYLSREKALFTAETFAVRNWYSQHDLCVDKPEQTPDDHISLQIRFLLYLLKEGKSSDAQQFYSEHLGKWLKDFCCNIATQEEFNFYTGLGELAKVWDAMLQSTFSDDDLSPVRIL